MTTALHRSSSTKWRKRIHKSSFDVQAATVTEALLSVWITTAWRTSTLLPMYFAIFSSFAIATDSAEPFVGRSKESTTSCTKRITLHSLTRRICRLQARSAISFVQYSGYQRQHKDATKNLLCKKTAFYTVTGRLVFNSTFSISRLHRAIGVWNILCSAGGQ